MDLGQRRRGVDMGPSAIRYANLQKCLENLGWKVRDGGNVDVPLLETVSEVPGQPHHLKEIAEVSHKVYQYMLDFIRQDEFAIFLGGDHSIALGTVAAALECIDQLGVLWVDAHGDFNTPDTSPSGNIHGMVVAALMGRGAESLFVGTKRLQAEQVVMIATRDLDEPEKIALRQSGIKVLTMRDIDDKGMAAVVREALAALHRVGAIHVSFDMDAIDPSVAPGVGTPVPGGLSYREAHLLMEMLADDGRVRSLDIVEVNPILDERNRTAQIAVEMVASLLGQKII
jgi:arginase